MKHRLDAHHLHLINVLRYLMTPYGDGVTDREWEVRAIFSGIAVPVGGGEPWLPVFPEFDDAGPFRVSGIRLVERVALVLDFEEAEFARFRNDGSDDVDLVLAFDGSAMVAEIADDATYERLKRYLDLTSAPEFNTAFY